MATATVHTVWDCRWSRPGHHITGIADALQPETTWVCVREGGRAAICEDDCARCSRWEPLTAMAALATTHSGAIFSDHGAETALVPRVSAPARVTLRAVLLILAVGFVAIGVSVLTAPLMVPFTVTLWLCAAAFAGLAVFGRFSD
jgi:hypothetical protein